MNAKVGIIFYFTSIIMTFFSRRIFLDNLGADFIGLTGTISSILGFLNITEVGIATSIDAFAVGIGFGLSSTVVQSLVTCSIIFAVTFLVACLGIFLGSRGKHIPQRLSGTIAGLVLIALAVKALL